jgi:hypothetical protein
LSRTVTIPATRSGRPCRSRVDLVHPRSRAPGDRAHGPSRCQRLAIRHDVPDQRRPQGDRPTRTEIHAPDPDHTRAESAPISSVKLQRESRDRDEQSCLRRKSHRSRSGAEALTPGSKPAREQPPCRREPRLQTKLHTSEHSSAEGDESGGHNQQVDEHGQRTAPHRRQHQPVRQELSGIIHPRDKPTSRLLQRCRTLPCRTPPPLHHPRPRPHCSGSSFPRACGALRSIVRGVDPVVCESVTEACCREATLVVASSDPRYRPVALRSSSRRVVTCERP